MYQIGIDEAGRGPAIGPLVVCALGIPNSDTKFLAAIGAVDSKQITKKKREEISERIYLEAENRNWKIGIIVCKASRIDIERNKINLNKLEIELFKEAVYETGIKEKNGIVKADACDVNEQRFKERIRYALGAKWKDWEIHARHKMDSEEIIVGAASILAKVRRDKEIEKISDLLNLDVGSGYPSDPKTKEAVKKLVNSKTPNQYLRWSWATVKNAWNSTHDLPIPIREELGRTRIQSSLNEWSNTEM
ncbi:MAG TPA: ribonuclease HII [Candidatus Thalassarchaeaceae archaeon]|nr:MAG TPA: ribonuclease HII [Candidatus Poseidoniales archaeon]HII13315.1 ribonuclease HII [Candidatus Thalassarchaeaceae archaeon]